LGILRKISSYPTYPIAVILKMAMHLKDPELTASRASEFRVLAFLGGDEVGIISSYLTSF